MTEWLVHTDTSGIEATSLLMRCTSVCPEYDGLRCFEQVSTGKG